MRTVYYVASSLDGYIAAPHEDLDWLMQFDALPGGDFPEFIAEVGALAMGSSTYMWVLERHVLPGAPKPMPWPYSQPAWVFTTRELPVPTGADVRFARGAVAPVHAAMVTAAGGKDVWIVGGGELAGQFHDAGLLDEMLVTYAPVALGAGAPLLPRLIATPPMTLLASGSYGGAMVQARYALPRPAAG